MIRLEYYLVWKYRNGLLLYAYYNTRTFERMPLVLPSLGYILIDEETLEAQVCRLCNKDHVEGNGDHISESRIDLTSGKTGAFFADKAIDNIRKNLRNLSVPNKRTFKYKNLQ